MRALSQTLEPLFESHRFVPKTLALMHGYHLMATQFERFMI
jgi:hypothetical protein